MKSYTSVAYKVPLAHTEDSTKESINEKDKKGDELRQSARIVEDMASSSNDEKKNADNLAENSGDEVDDVVSHTNVQQECGDDLKGNTSGVKDKVQPVNTVDSNCDSINAKDKEGEELRESMQTVTALESPSINLKGSSEDEVGYMMSPTNVQHDEEDDFERSNNGVEDKAQPVYTEESNGNRSKDEKNQESRGSKRSSSPESFCHQFSIPFQMS